MTFLQVYYDSIRMKRLAYTMGHKASYDTALAEVGVKIPLLEKIGRGVVDGKPYEGGCCWQTYLDAVRDVEENREKIGYEPGVYGLILPNGWEVDTTNDYKPGEHCNLLVNARIVPITRKGRVLPYPADQTEPECVRAGGDVICEVCGEVYYRHADDPRVLSYDGHPFMTFLCDGRSVKL